MRSLFHSTILATTFAATVAVGISSAAIIGSIEEQAAKKADRLTMVVPIVAASAEYVTVETRGDGISILQRVPLAPLTTN